jgi:5-methyltetrahydropteroyltriglutamate--homocysteine methyltransferase
VTGADWFGPKVTSKVARRRGITTAEFRFVRSLTRHTPKVTLPTPSAMHFFVGPEGLDTAAYPDLKSFFTDLARVYREELADLARLGCTYVQLDEVPLALLCDEAVRDAVRARGEDPIALTDFYVAAVNAALEGRPAGMTVGMHLCRGNYKSGWIATGGYDAVAERLFNDAHVDAFFLEYDTPRAGGFAPLRFVPAHKTVVLGLVSTKTPVLEDAGALARRVDEASRYVPLDRLAVSPQCGFASSAAGNPLTAEDQTAKLGLVARVAREVWT